MNSTPTAPNPDGEQQSGDAVTTVPPRTPPDAVPTAGGEAVAYPPGVLPGTPGLAVDSTVGAREAGGPAVGFGGLTPGPPPDLTPGEIPMSLPAAGDPGDLILGPSVPVGKARTYIGRSLSMLAPLRGAVTTSILLGLIVTALPFVSSATWGPIIQIFGQVAGSDGKGNLQGVWDIPGPRVSHPDGSAAGPYLSFGWWLGIWAGSLILAQVLGFLRAWIDAQVEWKLLAEVRQRVHDHLHSLSLDFFTGARSGMLMQRVLFEASGVQRLLTECVIPPVIDAAVLVIAVAYIVSLSWQMTVIALLISPFALVTLQYAGRRLQAATGRMMMAGRDLSGELEETISGMSDIQVFNAQQRRSERFAKASSEAAKSNSLMMVWIHLSGRSAQVFIALSQVLVLVLGVVFSSSFGLTLNGLVTFVAFVPTLFGPAERIIQGYTSYKSIVPQIASTYELLDTEPSVSEHPEAVDLDEVHGNIEFADVVFGYSPDQKILDGISFSIREGETVALVGAIGSGKSTIFNLLLRFLDPEHGRILLDGYDISSVSHKTLREQVSKLAQFPFFMKDTIRENVRLARQDASDAQVEEACELAYIHSVIVDPGRLARGYDTVVDVQVPSGGQKRLIAMARCLLRKPEVLLLDEPTENLDADQRTRLTQVIRDYASDRTCVVVSHDMDFIRAVADRIIVLEGGRVGQEGTHDELLAVGGLYKRLYEAQNVDPSLVRPVPTPA